MIRQLLGSAAERSISYLGGLDARSVAPSSQAVAGLARLDEPLPPGPSAPEDVLAMLDKICSPATTARVIADIQADGTCWCGSTVWQGRSAMRISVSSWATTEADVEMSLAAILTIAGRGD